MGREGGWIDLNFGTPEPVLSAIRSDNPREVVLLLAPPNSAGDGEARRSVKEVVVMNGWVAKVKLLVGCEFDKASKFAAPDEAIKYWEKGFEREVVKWEIKWIWRGRRKKIVTYWTSYYLFYFLIIIIRSLLLYTLSN